MTHFFNRKFVPLLSPSPILPAPWKPSICFLIYTFLLLFLFFRSPHVSEIIRHLPFSNSCHFAWCLGAPSALPRTARSPSFYGCVIFPHMCGPPLLYPLTHRWMRGSLPRLVGGTWCCAEHSGAFAFSSLCSRSPRINAQGGMAGSRGSSVFGFLRCLRTVSRGGRAGGRAGSRPRQQCTGPLPPRPHQHLLSCLSDGSRCIKQEVTSHCGLDVHFPFRFSEERKRKLGKLIARTSDQGWLRLSHVKLSASSPTGVERYHSDCCINSVYTKRFPSYT